MYSMVSSLKIFIIYILNFYTSIKILDKTDNKLMQKVEIIIISLIGSIIYKYLNGETSSNGLIIILIVTTVGFATVFKTKITYTLVINEISLAINQIVLILAIIISYIIRGLLKVNNDYIELASIMVIYFVLIILLWKINRIKHGITFLKRQKNNEYFNMVLFYISVGIILLVIMISNYQEGITSKFGVMLIIFAIVMFITIWKSLQLYYKQQMLEKVLEKTQKDLADKTEEVKKLEAENLSFSEISHSIAHRQDSLKHKLEKLSTNTEFADEISINAQIDNITKDLRKKTKIDLEKTGIEIVDDMLDCMQAKCVENNIDFQLQINGNIYHMTNNYIAKEDLEILLADHIKDAIIAINHCENINKSILVRIGKIDGIYGVYFYDSGIEFEFNTLLNLGKIPITTHKSEGGTGMGFMNTFKTLSKTKGSLEIEEIGKPSKSNFTKVLKFKFNNKNEYKIISYKGKELKEKDEENKLIIENIER